MAIRRVKTEEEKLDPDLTALIDVAFQLITFFVMLMTIANEDSLLKINLPVATTAGILRDDKIPNSITINVDAEGNALAWGRVMPMRSSGVEELRRLLMNEARLARIRQGDAAVAKEGLDTTVILRIDTQVECGIFNRIMDECRNAGFRKFNLKAREKDQPVGPTT